MDASSRYKELILRAVIKCGLLRKIVNRADHYHLLKFLPKGSVGGESRDIWRHVMKHAKDAGLLRDILEAAHRCGRVEEVVAGAVDSGVLDFHEEAEVARPIAGGVEKCQSFFIEFDRMDIFRVLTRPEVSIVQQNLVEQGKKDFVMRDVLEGAKQCEEEDLFCPFQHKWNLSAILTAAKEVGLLTNVLHAANENGLLGKTLAAAKDAGLLKNLLHAANEHGLLGKTVAAAKYAGLLTNLLHAASEHCLLGKTVAAAKYAGLLNDVLHAASEHGLLGKTLAAANDAGLLTNLLHAANKHGPLGKTVAAADAGPFTKLLHAASGHSLLGKTLAAANDAGLLTNLLHAANKHGPLGKTVAAADAGPFTNLLHAASEHGLLGKTLAAANDAGLLTNLLHAANKHGPLGKTVAAADAGPFAKWLHVASEHSLLRKTVAAAKHGLCESLVTVKRVVMYSSFHDYKAISFYELSNLWLSILHEESKIAAFFSILIWLLTNSMTQRCLRLCGTRNAEHRKSVISQVTICSGDIERNPGPLFLNDWLKEMYSMLVRKWKDWQKKKIPWKQFRMPDPRNSGLDRKTLIDLFQRYGLLTLCAIQDDSDIYTEEFQLLRVYINDRKEPNIDQLDKIVRRRKLLVKFKELYGELSHLPESERGEVQRAVNNIHLQCVPFSRQGEQGAVQEQREEEESDGANVEDEDEDRGAQISDGPPQPDCPCGAVVANNEAAMPTSSTIEDSVRQSNGPSGNNPDDFWNGTLTDDELIQLVWKLQEEYKVWFPEAGKTIIDQLEGDSSPDHTPTDPASQSSGPNVTNDSGETMKDTPDVTADPQILQPPGQVNVQSQKSQKFAIVPVEAPGQTPAPTPVPTTHVDIASQMTTLVQNLHYLTGIPDLNSRRISENDQGRITLLRKRSHSLDSGSNCMSSKMVRLT